MWGGVADTIAAAVVDGKEASERSAFDEATALIDALAAVAPIPSVRPTLVDLVRDGRTVRRLRRGSCCLWYQTQTDPDPCGEGFCDGCPRRDPVDQQRRWAATRR